jgi:Terminase large subunit, T4likevirus-type, N-terminal
VGRVDLGVRGLVVDPARLEGLDDNERAAVLEQLKFVEKEFLANPLLGYRPHGKQVLFHVTPQPPLRAFFGGNRSGKTTACMVDSLLQACDRDVVPAHLLPFKRWDAPFYCRVVTPDLGFTMDVVQQKIREWCPRSQLQGGSFDRAYEKVLRTLRFKNGSWFQFFSNDQDLDKFGGAALHRIVYDEEPRQDIRRECLMRLIDFGGEELFGMTPLNGMSWVYDEIYEPWERGALGDDRVIVADMDDNPHLDEKTKVRVLASMPLEERRARKSGRFVSFAGLIYPQFSTQRHVVPSQTALPADDQGSTVPPGVEVFAGVDPGYRHMCGVVFCYLDANDILTVFDEIAAEQRTVKQVCQEIDRRCTRWRVRPSWFVIDPASRNKSGQTGRSDQQEFADNGVVTIPGQNAVGAGINRVQERLEADRLRVAAHCDVLRGEFKRYRWSKESARKEDQSPEKPVKKDDHLLDALRYVVMQRPLRPDRELVAPTETMKDRLLRESLKRLRRGGQGRLPDHPSGAGIFA